METDELENELRALRPRRVPLVRQLLIERELHDERPARAPAEILPLPVGYATRRALGWGIAAAFLTGLAWFGLQPRSPSNPSGQDATVLSSRENVVLGTTDEGLITLADGSPARRYRIQSLETLTWTDRSGKASLTWTLPREDVRLVPVSFE
jgi:hypothetical protein